MNLIYGPTEYPPRQYRISLTVGDHSPGHLRRVVRAYLRLWDMAALTDAAELALTELLTNVIRHVPDRRCTARVLRRETGIRVEVNDGGPGLPAVVGAGAWDEGGRGLALLEAVTDAWDVEPDPVGGGKCVWFELKK
ncbi:ATP-binding protein [Streptomyces sp. NPDC051219]|uniref:ATP-binding protein n=1 Tax=Streptomyces sp. NPDC051219 TaxID=3155283 RepID=UPI0034204F58